MARKYRVLDVYNKELLSAKPYVSLRDAYHVVSTFRDRKSMIEVFNEKERTWEQYEPVPKRNRSGSIGTKDADYAKDLEMWVYSGIANELKPHMGGTIADRIAAAAGKAARAKYMEIAKRSMVR